MTERERKRKRSSTVKRREEAAGTHPASAAMKRIQSAASLENREERGEVRRFNAHVNTGSGRPLQVKPTIYISLKII